MSGGARYKRYSDAKMAAVCQSIEKDTLMRLWQHPTGGYEVTPMGQGAMPRGLTWYITASAARIDLCPLVEHDAGVYSSDGHACQLPLATKHIDALNSIAERIGYPDNLEGLGRPAELAEHISRPWESPNIVNIDFADDNSIRQHCYPRLWGGESRWRAYRETKGA